MNRLSGKVALIVGAGGRDNIGQAIARRFRQEGARVVVAGRNQSVLAELAEEIDGMSMPCDLTRPDQIRDMVSSARAWQGRLDCVVNCTGWGLLKPFLETTEEELERLTTLQFMGPFILCQAAVAAMNEGGSIIQISSATATIMFHDHAAYMGTKAGTDHVIRCVANEFGERGIRANSISPGLTDSPMTVDAKAVPGLFESFLPGYPLGRLGTPQDVAAAAVWLASDECYMTGENLQVNGGLTLRRNPTKAEIARSVEAGAGDRPLA